MIDSFAEKCRGNPSFVSWLGRRTPFFSVKEFVWLFFVIYNYFMNLSPRDLCVVVPLEEPHQWVR